MSTEPFIFFFFFAYLTAANAVASNRADRSARQSHPVRRHWETRTLDSNATWQRCREGPVLRPRPPLGPCSPGPRQAVNDAPRRDGPGDGAAPQARGHRAALMKCGRRPPRLALGPRRPSSPGHQRRRSPCLLLLVFHFNAGGQLTRHAGLPRSSQTWLLSLSFSRFCCCWRAGLSIDNSQTTMNSARRWLVCQSWHAFSPLSSN